MPEEIDPVAALLAEVDQEVLPPPAERLRLRKAAKVTRPKMAGAVGVREETIWAWETGRSEPRPPQRGKYAELLRGLAARFPPPVTEQPAPAPVAVPEAFAAAPVPEQAAPAQLVMLDQKPDGSLLMAAPLPCVQCGQPSVYRAQGLPMHLGGFCRPGATPAVPAAMQPVEQTPAVARQAAPAAAPPARRAASSRARKAPAKTAAAAEGPADWEAAAAARVSSRAAISGSHGPSGSSGEVRTVRAPAWTAPGPVTAPAIARSPA